MIDKLRSDFELVAGSCLASGEWTKADMADFGAAIKEAVERNDESVLILWARDMAIRANAVLYHQLVIKGVEASMRARVEQARGA